MKIDDWIPKTKTDHCRAAAAFERVKRTTAQLVEDAYRRGFEHGNLSAHYGITQAECKLYRRIKKTLPVLAPEKKPIGGKLETVYTTMDCVNLTEYHLNMRKADNFFIALDTFQKAVTEYANKQLLATQRWIARDKNKNKEKS